jgi:uncharacterized phage infection (PIP) family protein YhgE
MNIQAVMQAAPAKANELFARLFETSEGAVKTREKLFADLKAELELHINLEEQHLFPVLRRNAETKGLVADAIKDNKELLAKLVELDALPKNDETFAERLKDLQKAFRQHARDEKRELLPAVQRALSETQVQGVTQKMEAAMAEAEQARHDELQERRMKARQEREQAERELERLQEAERAKKAEAARVRHAEAEQKQAQAQLEREQAGLRAEHEAAARRVSHEAVRQAHDTAEMAVQTAATGQTNVLRMTENAATGAQRIQGEIGGAVEAYTSAAETIVPNAQSIASLPGAAAGAMTDIRSAWIAWMSQTTQAGAEMSLNLLRQAAEQQRQFAANTAQRWMEHNTRIMQFAMRMTQQGVGRIASHSTGNMDEPRADQ